MTNSVDLDAKFVAVEASIDFVEQELKAKLAELEDRLEQSAAEAAQILLMINYLDENFTETMDPPPIDSKETSEPPDWDLVWQGANIGGTLFNRPIDDEDHDE